MTNDEIDLFVDRMCGYWPTTNIARNTVKSAWKMSMPLRDLPHQQAKLLLEKIKTMPGFPSLNMVEQLAATAMGKAKRLEDCADCEGKLWLPVAPRMFMGVSYSQVVRCPCNGGSWDEVSAHGGVYAA